MASSIIFLNDAAAKALCRESSDKVIIMMCKNVTWKSTLTLFATTNKERVQQYGYAALCQNIQNLQ